MRATPRIPVFVWQLMRRLNRLMLSRYGEGSKSSRRVLILTTVGRKSGKLRKTPLQYEEVEGVFYVASARGEQADWYRNLAACPEVHVQVGGRHFSTYAILMTDPCQVADFIELRMRRHPLFMGVMFHLEGLPAKFTRADLEEFAKRLAVVKLDPSGSEQA